MTLTPTPLDNAMEMTSVVSLVTVRVVNSNVSFTDVRLAVTSSPLYKTMNSLSSVSFILTYKQYIKLKIIHGALPSNLTSTMLLLLLSLTAIALKTVAVVFGAANFVRACTSKSSLSVRNSTYSPSPLKVYDLSSSVLM